MNRRKLVEKAARRGKYAQLYHYLSSQRIDRLETTFAELEHILGFTLPDSARLYRPWWANQAKAGHSQAMAWGAAGWKTAAVDLEGETLRFERDALLVTDPVNLTKMSAENAMDSERRFWVYENWTHERAIVHEANCSFCNDGRGMHSGSSNWNGRWHGPFDSRGAAERKAAITGRRMVRPCKTCIGS